MSAHPDGSGTAWTGVESVDVDQPHGLDFRYANHIAKAVRKRIEQEHETFGDNTAGGAHIPGWCKVLKHVDGTADVSASKDATLFQYNGIVHSMAKQNLWCITGAGADPTVLLIHPDKQYKGGDVTWLGHHQFDSSVDMTILHCVSATLHTLLMEGSADMSDTLIEGTLDVEGRADFSSIGVSGDSTITGQIQFNAFVDMEASVAFGGNVDFSGTNVYDSSGFEMSAAGTYTKAHNLGTTAIEVHLYCCSPLAGPACSSAWKTGHWEAYGSGSAAGSQVVDISTGNLTVHTGANGPLYKLASDGTPLLDASCYGRVVATRMI